jgi:AraC family transcriptional regulator, transcriptional activator FtrA
MKVSALAVGGMSAFHLSVPGLIFGEDRTGLGLPRFDYALTTQDGAPVDLAFGLGVAAPAGVDRLATSDIAIVPSWRDLDGAVAPALAEALRAVIARGGRVVSLCLGTYALAGAGLLDGRRATTHWSRAEHFARRFPKVELDPAALYVEDGPVLTSAGVAAGIDCCLHLIRQIAGEAVASNLARHIIMAPHRAGGQAQFITRPMPADARAGRLGAALNAIARRAAEPWPLDQAANLAGLTRRSFSRHLRAETGLSFGDWLAEQRLSLAREMLETTGLPVETIAVAAGLGTPTNLRQHFARAMGVTPSAYRAQFAA